MKKNCAHPYRLAGFLLRVGLAVALWLVYTGASAQCTYLLNTDFESSTIAQNTVVIADQSTLVPPWRTTAPDGQIEVWRFTNAYSGSQYVELNANVVATLYQNFTATAGSTFTVNFAHRGRQGIDVMNVSVGTPDPTSSNVSSTTLINLGNFTDNNTAWGYYTVTFTLPANNGNFFSLRFTSVSAAGGNNSVGNFLDAISIADAAPTISGSGSVTINCPTSSVNLATTFPATNTPANNTQTWHTGPVATADNRIASVTAVSAGTYYTAFFNSVKQCYGATRAVTVTQAGVPPAPTATATAQPSCSTPSGTITVTAPLNASFTYSIDGTNYQTATTFAGVAPGTYAVRVRNGTTSTCTSTPTSVTINALQQTPQTPTASVTSQPSCTVATGTIIVSAPTGASLTYSINGTTYQTSTTFTAVSPGSYSVTVRNSTNCTSLPTSVTVNPQPTISATLTSATVCSGTPASLTATGGNSYRFSTNPIQTNTTGIVSVTPTVTTTYTVTATSTQGCTATASGTVTVNPTPQLTLNSATVCAGTATTLTVNGCSGTLRWSTGNTTATIVATPLATTVYSATCTLETTCSATISSTVTVNATPSFTQAPTPVAATCSGATANNDARINFTTLQNTERADISAGSTYTGPAYAPTGNRPVSNGAVSFTSLANPATEQPYTVRLFSANGTCFTDVTVTVTAANCRCPSCISPRVQRTP